MPDLASLLLDLAFPEPMSGCWIWTGRAHEEGGGRFKPYFMMDGKQWLAHRASKWIFHGQFPLKAFICHHCDNSLCVNPDHLYVGDHKSNMRDMARRGRARFARRPQEAKEAGRALGQSNTWTAGEGNAKAKLTTAQAHQIKADTRPTKVVAEEYGLHRTTVQRIRRGALWN